MGTNRVQQNLLGYWDFTSGQPYQQGGKGLGKNGSGYEYFAAVLGCICQGTVLSVLNVYSQNGRLNLNSASENYVVPSGGGTYTVANAAAYAADAGAGAITAYSHTADNYGAPGPVTMTGTYVVPHASVPSSPGVNQYSQSAGTYTFPPSSAGLSMTVTYSFSLYVLSSTEDYIIPASNPFEITVQYAPEWRSDQGVIFVFTGVALINVGGTPGPGEYSNDNSGNYFFNAADANQAIAISYTWRQSNSNVDPSSQLNFTLIEGEMGQDPWTYLTSKHASQAFGYSTLACIGAESMDLGESATIPNYNFEVMTETAFGAGILDAAVDLCIAEMLQNPFYGSGFSGAIDASLATIAADYWNSNGFFISPVLNAAQSCSSIIEEWCEAGNVGVFWSEGLLKFIPYGDTTTIGNGYLYTPQTAPLVDLNDDDFLAGQDDDPVTIERTPWQDAYNSVKVQFSNRLNAYNQDIVQETDDYAIGLFGLRPEPQKDYGFLCTATAATFSANIRIKRLVYIRGKYHFTISALRYCFIEPMDLVTLTDIDLGLNKTPVRIVETEENENYELECTAEEFPWGTATATIYPKQPALPPPPPPALADPGNTNIVSVFEPTTRVAVTLANSAFQIWMALNGGPNWGGCNVWMSKDGQSYQQIGTQTGPTRAGIITADLPAGDSNPDTANTLSVATSGQLFNVTEQQANALSTLCKVGPEYLAYANATITGSDGQATSFYNLNYLQRGAFSSPNVAHDHSNPNENSFIRLDTQVFQYSFDPSLAGDTVYFKFTSFNLLQNQVQQLADVNAFPYTINGVNLSSNMMVDAILDGTGLTADIRIYQAGQAVGTPGSAELNNGSLITLPAVTISGEELSTLYYVNFNPNTSTYVIYTDENQFLLDEQISGYIRIGSVTTPTDFTVIPLMGGGSIAIGCGQNAPYGSAIELPAGYDYSRMIGWVSPAVGFTGRDIVVEGVFQSSIGAGGVLTSSFQGNFGGSIVNATTNWVAASWTAGAPITLFSIGSSQYVQFTTLQGDTLCLGAGTIYNGVTFQTPPGFHQTQFLNISGMVSSDNPGHIMQGVQFCSLNSGLVMSSQYNDNDGNEWFGNAGVFGIFWNSGGGVASGSVSGGNYITIPTTAGHSVAFIQAYVEIGFSFGVPSAYGDGSLAITCAMAGWVPHGSSHDHGYSALTSGTTYSGFYTDDAGSRISGFGNIFAIATI